MTKLGYLCALGAHRLDLSATPPSASVSSPCWPEGLAPEDSRRRHPILLAALAAAHSEIVDETVRLFDMVLATTDSKARDRVAERQLEAALADVSRLALLDDILDVVLDLSTMGPSVPPSGAWDPSVWPGRGVRHLDPVVSSRASRDHHPT